MPPTVDPARAAPVPTPSLRTVTTRCSSRTCSSTSIDVAPGACLRTLVRASWTTRYPVAATPAGSTACSIPGSVRSRTRSPAGSNRATSSATPASSAPGVRAPSSAWPRSTPTIRRIAVSASAPACSMDSSARSTSAGLVRATIEAACAAITIPVTWWATTSCSSRASSIRSALRASSSWASRRELASRSISPIAAAPIQPITDSSVNACAVPASSGRRAGDATIATADAAHTWTARRSGAARSAAIVTTASASCSQNDMRTTPSVPASAVTTMDAP